MENLVAFMLRSIISKIAMEYTERLLGILYLYFVVSNLIRFISPLKERDTVLVRQCKERLDLWKGKFRWLVGKVAPPCRRPPTTEEEEGYSRRPARVRWVL